MAERTISITPIKGVTLDRIQQEFAQFAVEKLALVAEKSTAFVQFANAGQVEALGERYPDCMVEGLGNAEIGFVEQDFKWPASKTTAKQESLVAIKNCQDVKNTSQDRVRQIFKKFGIDKVVKFEESREIVLQFHNQEDLELLDMNFIGLKVAELGPEAQIDEENIFPVDKFIQKYLEQNEVRIVERKEQKAKEEKKEETKEAKIENYLKQKEEQKRRKEEESRRKMEEMQREIQEKERLRKQAIEYSEKQKREKEEKERLERQKKEQQQRQKRAIIQLRQDEQRKKEQSVQRQKDETERQKRQQIEAKMKEKQDKQRIQREQKQQEEELAKRIASIKREIQQQQSTQMRRNSAEQMKAQSQLQRILSRQKQLRTQKEIKLPQIISITTKASQKLQSLTQSHPVPPKPFIPHDYSKISTHFLTLAILSWIYYIFTR